MADTIELDAGSGGAICATDDCGAAGHTQIVKLAYSGDGVATPILADAKGLEVQQATAADLNVTEASAAAIKTAVEAIDNAVDGNYLNVNVNCAGTDIPAGGGVEAAALRVTIATDSTGVISVDDNGGALTVDGTVTANAGTNLNTSALALEAGGNLAAIKAKADNIPPLGQALAAASVPVILPAATITTLTPPAAITGFATAVLQGGGLPAALGAGGGLKVDGSGTALPVTGTITAVTAISNALPAGTNAIGKLAANSGVDIGDVDILSIAAGDNNIGNVDIASIAAGDNNIGNVDVLTIAAGSNLIGDVAIGNRASGGATPYSYISDGTDFVSVTDGATTLYALSCTSIDATVVYIKVYDKATAPDPSADAASIKLRFAVPSLATGAGFVWSVPQGMDFPTGLGFALVTGAADTDETAVTANEVMVNMVYKH